MAKDSPFFETYVDLGKTVYYSYNELGLLDTMQTPEGELVSYKRDAAGRTTSMIAPYSIGAVFHWDDRGRLDALVYANGTAAAYEYFPDDLLSRYSWQERGGTLFDHRYSYGADRRLAGQSENGFQWTYGYDPAGRLDEVSYPVPLIQNIKGWQGGQFPPGHAVDYSSIYSGISASSPPRAAPPGQIKKAESEETQEGEAAFPDPVAREQWSYDDVANTTGRTRDGGYESFSYEGLNRLTQAGTIRYAYNAAAEVAAKTDDSGTTRYEWNSRGELIQARLPGGATLRYGYDAFGRMVRRELSSAPGKTTPTQERSGYLWHGLELLAEYDVSPGGSASPYKEYFYAEQVLVAVKMHGFHGRREPGSDGFLQTKGGVMYYHSDRLGNPLVISDRHGDPIARYAWDAYGRVQAGIFEPYNSVGYTGHLYDQETGLTYFGARWYDADTGRFLSRDPIQDGWNWYAYVGGDPVNFVDLWGLEAEGNLGTSIEVTADVMNQTVANQVKNALAGATFRQSPVQTGINAVKIAAESVLAAAEISIESSPIFGKLTRNLVARGITKPDESAAHHIVARIAGAAEDSRKILDDWGIGIDDAANGVFLPASTKSKNPTGAAVHSTLHTTAYYDTVTEMLRGATSKEDVIEVLGQIRDDLLSGGFN